MASPWVGAASPSCSLQIAQDSATVRRPSSKATNMYAASLSRKNWLLDGSWITCHIRPR